MGSSHHHHHHSSGLVPRGSHMASMSDSEVNQEAKPEVKPEVKPETHINLKVSDGSSEIFFKIKKTTPLRRLMEAFAKRQGKEMDSLRFLYDGIRIQADQTPEDLDMEDNDIIEAHREQIGGMVEGQDYMRDYRGKELFVNDIIALYYGFGGLETGRIVQIKNHRAKVEVTYSTGEKVMSKWKYGDCMVKLYD